MPRELEDRPEMHLVTAQPEAGSVSTQQVAQFLLENHIPESEQIVVYELSNVPADRWDKISTYLHNNSSKISYYHIRLLRNLPIDRFDVVITLVTAKHITNENTLEALSVIAVTDLNDFQTFLQNDDIMQRGDHFQFIFALMSKDKWSAFSAFIRRNHQFDKNIMNFGVLFTKFPEESWETLLHYAIKIDSVDINRLSKMSPEDLMTYLAFLQAHQVSNWEAKNVLIDMPVDKRERVWIFAKENDLVNEIPDLAKISDVQWDAVTRFILKHPKTSVNSLASLSVEQWDLFERFVNKHQMTDGEWISEFAKVPADMRENIFIYQQEYKPTKYHLNIIRKIPVYLWPQFMATIKRNGITDYNVINRIAKIDSSEWEELTSFIAQKKITDDSTVEAIVNASQVRYRALLAFVQQFDIHDQHIIYGLASIPLQHWENIMRISEPLLQPPLNPDYRGVILITVYEITKREYRADREMPVYGEDERQGRIAYALEEIANGRMPDYPYRYTNRLIEILKTPQNEHVDMRQAAQAGATSIDVHAEGRDNATTEAMRLFIQLPYDLTNVNSDYEAFMAYVNALPHAFTKMCVHIVLGLQQAEGFAPISADRKIESYGLNLTGREFFARLWHFIHHGDFVGVTGDVNLAKERENSRIALVLNLADAFEEELVVCNPGKIQRIVVGVLQGRLKNVHVDREVPVNLAASSQTTLSPQQEKNLLTSTVAASLRDFLRTYESMVKTQQTLKAHVEAWLQHERGLQGHQVEDYRRQFLADLDSYLALSELSEQDADLNDSPPIEVAEQDHMLQLRHHIGALKLYGHQLQEHKQLNKGQKVINLADDISAQVKCFTDNSLDIDQVSENLSNIITNGKKLMGKDRKPLDIIAHIVLAFTGIGLIIIIGKKLLSDSKSGYLNQTKRQKLLAKLEKQLNKVPKPKS